MKAFVAWFEDGREGKVVPIEVYRRVVEESNLAVQIPAKIDVVLLDILMYNDSKLVQEALNLLMVHKNHKEQLFQVMRRIQVGRLLMFQMSWVLRQCNNFWRQ